MTLTALADLAEVIGALGVIAGLVFVGIQVRQQTKQLRRAEANVAMAQASAVRELVLGSREVAEMLTVGLSERPLDAADELRMNTFFSEFIYIAMQVWDREKYGLNTVSDFRSAIVPTLTVLLTSIRGASWWRRSRAQFPAGFVALVEEEIPAVCSPAVAAPSATAPQGTAGAVAPPGDAG